MKRLIISMLALTLPLTGMAGTTTCPSAQELRAGLPTMNSAYAEGWNTYGLEGYYNNSNNEIPLRGSLKTSKLDMGKRLYSAMETMNLVTYAFMIGSFDGPKSTVPNNGNCYYSVTIKTAEIEKTVEITARPYPYYN